MFAVKTFGRISGLFVLLLALRTMTVLLEGPSDQPTYVKPNALDFSLTMRPMDSRETASRIRIMRAFLGFKQPEFGALINRRRQSIGRWEDGEGLPEPYVLEKLAVNAGFSPTYFTDEEIKLPTPEEAAAWRRAYKAFKENGRIDEAADLSAAERIAAEAARQFASDREQSPKAGDAAGGGERA